MQLIEEFCKFNIQGKNVTILKRKNDRNGNPVYEVCTAYLTQYMKIANGKAFRDVMKRNGFRSLNGGVAYRFTSYNVELSLNEVIKDLKEIR